MELIVIIENLELGPISCRSCQAPVLNVPTMSPASFRTLYNHGLISAFYSYRRYILHLHPERCQMKIPLCCIPTHNDLHLTSGELTLRPQSRSELPQQERCRHTQHNSNDAKDTVTPPVAQGGVHRWREQRKAKPSH